MTDTNHKRKKHLHDIMTSGLQKLFYENKFGLTKLIGIAFVAHWFMSFQSFEVTII